MLVALSSNAEIYNRTTRKGTQHILRFTCKLSSWRLSPTFKRVFPLLVFLYLMYLRQSL